MPDNLKEAIYERCQQVLAEKITVLQNTLGDLRNSAANETKSTAGDKHETALAMLQIEQENTGRQLKHLLDQQRDLLHTDMNIRPLKIGKGCLIVTNKGTFFIAVGLGKLQVNGQVVYAISMQSPMSVRLTGLKPNDSFQLNGIAYTVQSFS